MLSAASREASPIEPTKEVYLNTQLAVKDKPSQLDLDQFFKDQPHLAPPKQEGSLPLAPFGLPSAEAAYNQLPLVGQAAQEYQLATLLGQLGVPAALPDAFTQIVAGPFTLISHLVSR